MYNDTIKAENRIISNEDLTEIFQAMGETLKKYLAIYKQEELQNRMLDSSYQRYTFKDGGSSLKARIDFYDNTDITFDNYDNFMSVFYSRLDEIKYIDIWFKLYYEVITPEPYKSREFYSQSIQMTITENKMDISLSLSSQDPKLNDLYNLIKSKVLNAPPKYDDIIKNKKKITSTISFATGIIPGIVLTSLLLFIPVVNTIFFKGFITYPIVALIFAFVIGGMFGASKVEKYYKPILPNRIYAGHDKNYHSVYKDDIDDYINKSEILIGQKANNYDNRRLIKEIYEKHKNSIPKLLFILLVASLVVIVIGLFI